MSLIWDLPSGVFSAKLDRQACSNVKSAQNWTGRLAQVSSLHDIKQKDTNSRTTMVEGDSKCEKRRFSP